MAVCPAAGLTMPTAPAQANVRNDRRITVTVCVFLTAIIWIVFGQTLTHDFVNFDDDRYVYENLEVNRGLTLDGLKWVLTHSHASLWHPLTTLSHMADCQIFGLKPGGHHFANVALHNIAAVLLFLDYWPLQRASDFHAWRRMIIEKIPLFALSAAASVATVFAQTVTMASLEQLPLLPRLKNAAVSLIAYLRQMFRPTDLAVFYPHPHDQLNIWIVLMAAALIIAITLVAIVVRQKHPAVFVGWFWYLVLLAPVIGIVQAGLQARADRFTYLPHIGITMLLTWTSADLTQRWRNRRVVLTSIATFAIVVSIILAYQQTTYWRDSVTLWKRAL